MSGQRPRAIAPIRLGAKNASIDFVQDAPERVLTSQGSRFWHRLPLRAIKRALRPSKWMSFGGVVRVGMAFLVLMGGIE